MSTSDEAQRTDDLKAQAASEIERQGIKEYWR